MLSHNLHAEGSLFCDKERARPVKRPCLLEPLEASSESALRSQTPPGQKCKRQRFEDGSEKGRKMATSLVASFPSRSEADLRICISALGPQVDAGDQGTAQTSPNPLAASSGEGAAPLPPLEVVVVDPSKGPLPPLMTLIEEHEARRSSTAAGAFVIRVANFQGLKSAEVTAMVQRTRNWSKQAFVPAGAAVNPADAAAVGGAAAAFHRAAAGDGHDSSYGDSHCNGCASRGEDEQHSSNGNGRSCHGTSTCNCSSSGSTKKNNSTTCRALPASPSWRRCAYRIASKGINNRHTGGGAHQAAKHGLEDRAAYWARAAQDTPAFYSQGFDSALHTTLGLPWNLNQLGADNLLSSLLPQPHPGITTTYGYLGTAAATFAWHVEDGFLGSMNVNLGGGDKVWYTLSANHQEAFESKVLATSFPADLIECQGFSQHKHCLVPPATVEALLGAGHIVHTHTQVPGDLVVTLPGAFHCGFSMSANYGEATNWATPKWLKAYEDPPNVDCSCRNGLAFDRDAWRCLRRAYAV